MTWPLLPMKEVVIDTSTLLHALSGTTTSKNAMPTSVGYGAGGYIYASVATHPLFSVIKIMMTNIIYIFIALISHMHMSDVTNIV
jgi:hypothetical protein